MFYNFCQLLGSYLQFALVIIKSSFNLNIQGRNFLDVLLGSTEYSTPIDMWGVGCVFFEVLSLYPLFPGTNELDQVTKIHQILGTPPAETLAKLKKHSNSHIDFNFPHKEAQPMTKLIPHCSPDCIDIIVKLLAYDPDDRLSTVTAWFSLAA